MNMKRSLSLLLVLVLMLTMVPVSVRAEECAHENLRYSGNTTEFVCLDDTYHNQISHLYYTCEDCGARVWGETITQKEYHDIFYLDNFCTACGYRPGSTHIHDYKVSATDTKVEKVDSTYHNVVTTTYTQCSCGAEGESTVATVQEAHTLDSNRKCTRCDYQAPCTHENYSYEMETVGYERIDGLFHAWSYRSYEKCTDCGKILENYGTTSTQEYHKKVPGSSTTSLVPVDDTYHNVVTTTRMSCPCGYYSNSKSTVQEQHNVQGYGYDTGHPHQKYSVCTCGAHTPVKDQYQTVNGILQDANQCCICHGHKFGAAQEVTPGTWQKTCTNCGITQAAQNPTQPTVPETEPEETEPGETLPEEIHEHEFVYGSATAEHPHFTLGYCSCGVGSTSREYHFACCQCSGAHIWGEVIRLPDDSFRMICTKCNASQTVTPSGDVLLYYRVIDTITYRHNAAKVYQDAHDIDSASSAIWKTVAGQATDALTDRGFTWQTEMLNNLSDQKGTIINEVVEVFDEETWDRQQTEMWETLLIEMLHKQPDIKKDADADSAAMNDFAQTSSSLAAVTKNLSESAIKTLNAQAETLNKLRYQFDTNVRKDIRKALEDVEVNKGLATDAGKISQEFGYIMTALSIATEGTSSAQIVKQQNEILAEIKQNQEYVDILDSILNSAEACGNDNLAAAAKNLQKKLNESIENEFLQMCSVAEAFFAGIATAELKEGVEMQMDYFLEKGADAAAKAIEKWSNGKIKAPDGGYLGILEAIELGAKVTKYLVNWDEAYQAAQKLMTLNQMDATMNIVQVLKEEDNPYMAELWGMLQTEGCEQAKVFLEEWEAGAGLSVEDFGIKEGTLSTVNRQLDIEKNFHINMLGLSVSKA